MVFQSANQTTQSIVDEIGANIHSQSSAVYHIVDSEYLTFNHRHPSTRNHVEWAIDWQILVDRAG
jgi:hypothetical protein